MLQRIRIHPENAQADNLSCYSTAPLQKKTRKKKTVHPIGGELLTSLGCCFLGTWLILKVAGRHEVLLHSRGIIKMAPRCSPFLPVTMCKVINKTQSCVFDAVAQEEVQHFKGKYESRFTINTLLCTKHSETFKHQMMTQQGSLGFLFCFCLFCFFYIC